MALLNNIKLTVKISSIFVDFLENMNFKKFALNLQLQVIQILTNDVQMLILCLSYFITTVAVIFVIKTNFRFRFMIFDDFFQRP